MRRFAVSCVFQSDGKTFHALNIVTADNKDEAEAMGMRLALRDGTVAGCIAIEIIDLA